MAARRPRSEKKILSKQEVSSRKKALAVRRVEGTGVGHRALVGVATPRPVVPGPGCPPDRARDPLAPRTAHNGAGPGGARAGGAPGRLPRASPPRPSPWPGSTSPASCWSAGARSGAGRRCSRRWCCWWRPACWSSSAWGRRACTRATRRAARWASRCLGLARGPLRGAGDGHRRLRRWRSPRCWSRPSSRCSARWRRWATCSASAASRTRAALVALWAAQKKSCGGEGRVARRREAGGGGVPRPARGGRGGAEPGRGGGHGGRGGGRGGGPADPRVREPGARALEGGAEPRRCSPAPTRSGPASSARREAPRPRPRGSDGRVISSRRS